MPVLSNDSKYSLLVTAKYHINPFLSVPDWKPYELSWDLDPGDSIFVFNSSLLEVIINMYLTDDGLISDSNKVALISITKENELNTSSISITDRHAEVYGNQITRGPGFN